MTWLDERENEQERRRQAKEDFKGSLSVLLSLSSRLRMLPANKYGYWFRYEMNSDYQAVAHQNGHESKKRNDNDASWSDYYKYLDIEQNGSNALIKLSTENRSVFVDNYYDDDEQDYRHEYKHTPSVLYSVSITISKLKTLSESNWLTILGWCMGENSLDDVKRVI